MNLVDRSASPATKLDAILLHLYNYENPHTGKSGRVGGTEIDVSMSYMNFSHDYFGLSSYPEMAFYLGTLIDLDYLERVENVYIEREGPFQQRVSYPTKCRITFKGLNHCHTIENKGELSNRCFVAMAFDDKREARLSAIKAACAKFGFDAFDTDGFEVKDNQTIDSKIISAIKSSRFCIADFTGLNQGAYMESGLAMGRNMKVIFVCEDGDFEKNKKHFDVRHYPFIMYENFPDLTRKLISEIGAYIKE